NFVQRRVLSLAQGMVHMGGYQGAVTSTMGNMIKEIGKSAFSLQVLSGFTTFIFNPAVTIVKAIVNDVFFGEKFNLSQVSNELANNISNEAKQFDFTDPANFTASVVGTLKTAMIFAYVTPLLHWNGSLAKGKVGDFVSWRAKQMGVGASDAAAGYLQQFYNVAISGKTYMMIEFESVKFLAKELILNHDKIPFGLNIVEKIADGMGLTGENKQTFIEEKTEELALYLTMMFLPHGAPVNVDVARQFLKEMKKEGISEITIEGKKYDLTTAQGEEILIKSLRDFTSMLEVQAQNAQSSDGMTQATYTRAGQTEFSKTTHEISNGLEAQYNNLEKASKEYEGREKGKENRSPEEQTKFDMSKRDNLAKAYCEFATRILSLTAIPEIANTLGAERVKNINETAEAVRDTSNKYLTERDNHNNTIRDLETKRDSLKREDFESTESYSRAINEINTQITLKNNSHIASIIETFRAFDSVIKTDKINSLSYEEITLVVREVLKNKEEVNYLKELSRDMRFMQILDTNLREKTIVDIHDNSTAGILKPVERIVEILSETVEFKQYSKKELKQIAKELVDQIQSGRKANDEILRIDYINKNDVVKQAIDNQLKTRNNLETELQKLNEQDVLNESEISSKQTGLNRVNDTIDNLIQLAFVESKYESLTLSAKARLADIVFKKVS
ncbi:MAG: hypothetical protein ACD_79C01380G0001, partial [uncultured bacterium]